MKRISKATYTMGKKTGLTPTKTWRERVKEKSINYYLQGHTTLKEVAERVSNELPRKCSPSLVYTVIQEALAQWAKDNAEVITNYKLFEIERINNLEREAWAAWIRSQVPERLKMTKSTPVDNKAKTKKGRELLLNEVIETERHTPGNKRFLDTVQWCITKRLEIMASMAIPAADADKPGTLTSNTTIRQIVFKGRTITGPGQTIVTNEN